MRGKDGKILYIEVLSAPYYSEKGIIGFQGIARDITERKRAEESFRDLSARQEAILAAIPDIIMEVDNNKVYTWANQAGIKFFGEDVIGKEAAFYFEGEQDTYDVVQPLFNGNENVIYVESWQRRKDGQKRLLAWWCRTLKDAHGNVIGALSSARDITERKRAEEALRESEDKFRFVFEYSVVGKSITLPSGEIHVNNAFCEMLGYSPEELQSKSWQDVTHPDDIEMTQREINALLSCEKEAAHFTKRYLQKNGSVVWADVRTSLRRDQEGKPLYFMTTLVDITERKRAEEAWRASEDRYRMLAENMSDTIWLMDMNLRTIYISPSVTRSSGYTLDELNAQPLDQQLTPDSLTRAMELFAEALSPENLERPDPRTTYSVELEFYRKDGSKFWSENTFTLILDQNKQPTNILGTGRDITERKQAEEALRQAEKNYRSIFENAVEGIYQSSTQGRFTSVNSAMARIFGYASPDEVVTSIMNIRDQFYADPGRRTTAMQQLEQKGTLENFESECLRKDGSQIWISENARAVRDANGTLLHYEGFIQDITERKQAEQALRESEQRFRSLIENASDLVLILNPDYTIAYVSPSVERILGHTVAAVVGARITDFIDPQDFPDFIAATEHRTRTPGPSPFLMLVRVRHADGSWRTLEGMGSNLLDQPGVSGLVINARDITERKRAEARIAYQANLLAQVSDAIVASDEQYRLTAWNRAAEAMYGWRAEEVLERDGREILRTEWASADPEEMRQMIAETGRWRGEATQQRKDGTRFPVEMSSLVLRDDSGQITGYVSANRDITERKQAEEQMHQRLAELEALHTVSTALRTAQTRDEALPILIDETLTALETDAGAVWLYHADSDELHAAVTRGWYRQLSENPIKPGEGVAGTVFTSGRTRVSAEIVRDPLVRQPATGEIPAGWGGVCLPIHTGAITVGVLFVAALLPRQITTEQVKLLGSLAEMAGAALHRMRLYEETVRQLDRLEALHSIDIAISASMDLQMTLNILLEHVKTQLNADATSVLLLNPHSQTLEYAAGRGFRTRSAQTARIRLGENFAGRAALERRAVQAGDPAQIQKSPHFAALWAGEDFTDYYGVPLIAKGEVKGVLEVYHRAPFHPEPDWISFLETLAGQAAIAIDSAQLFGNLQHSNVDLSLAYDATIEGWSRAFDLRDKETEGHTQRVTEITMQLAKAMGIGDAELVHIHRGALLHDIGKMGVPDSILFKPGPLTDDEWKVMRLHPQLAYDLLSPINYLQLALDIPYCHHEKWDGTGYPRGLKGEQIPLAARIFAVTDVWDALCSDRPYRAAWPKDKVLEHIRSLAGTHLDPRVVKECLESGVLETRAPE